MRRIFTLVSLLLQQSCCQLETPFPSPSAAPRHALCLPFVSFSLPSISYFHLLVSLILLYVFLFFIHTFYTPAQRALTYLHWIQPPKFLFPLSDFGPYRLHNARHVSQQHLCGWHLVPPSPPFLACQDHEAFEDRLKHPNQLAVLFLHGNSGNRAFPPKRIMMLQVLRAHLHAHVVTFDYSGFGDSSGSPSEEALSSDARNMFKWLNDRLHSSSTIIVYGQSLGTFAAVDLAANLGSQRVQRTCLLILDAPPASLIEAVMSHPIAFPFRILPNMRAFLRLCLDEKLDSASKIALVKLPTLILHGTDDRMITVEQGRYLYECAKKGGVDVHFEEFETCGHNNVSSAPNYLKVVNEFILMHHKVK
ncbi:unnamed protein product [Agarophyton chilense]